MSEISFGTLYEANKQLNLKEPLLPELGIAAAQKNIEDWFNEQIDCYAMLLNYERKDFTLFHLYENQNPNPCAIAAREAIGCLTDRGSIISIEKDHPDQKKYSWEIWLKIDDEAFCYYLFCYDNMVIEC